MPNVAGVTGNAGAASRFHEPRPSFFLMRVLGFVSRWCLLRGHFQIRAFDFPQADRDRLARVVNERTAAFLAPNHPEFGLDWMMDKEISTLVAPRMASWASHGIVASAPRFWTRNNLVSNNGGEAARNYSIAWAMRGYGVLLHPEGSVHWTANTIHPLFHGIAEMATEAARRLAAEESDRPVFIVPIVWKYHYANDVSTKIHREMATIERALSLESGGHLGVAERFCALQGNVLSRQMVKFGFNGGVTDADFFSRQQAFRRHLVDDLASSYAIEPGASVDRAISRLEKAITRARENAAGDAKLIARLDRDRAKVEEAKRLGGFSRDVYGTPRLSQEQIFESLKRLRASLLNRGIANALHNYLPAPYGPRIAHVRVPEPLVVDPRRASGDATERAAYVESLIGQAHARMQDALDAINRELAADVRSLGHPNPFVDCQDACGGRHADDRAI